nr:uncharacterized protein CTRU02_04802 [Colletotrichum truncatum]KAF6795239.1 hypothetical protein CTRU02_04802 [Colletotrichum truncatum]
MDRPATRRGTDGTSQICPNSVHCYSVPLTAILFECNAAGLAGFSFLQSPNMIPLDWKSFPNDRFQQLFLFKKTYREKGTHEQ